MLHTSLMVSLAWLVTMPGDVTAFSAGQPGNSSATPSAKKVGQQIQVDVLVAAFDPSMFHDGAALDLRKLREFGIQVPESVPSASYPIFGVIKDERAFLGVLTRSGSKGLARIVAKSSVRTPAGQPVSVVAEDKWPKQPESARGSSPRVSPVRTSLNVLPTILADGKILLEVEVEVRQRILNISVVGRPDLPRNLYNMRHVVQMKEGETLAHGGATEMSRMVAITRKVPILGDLPVVGALFRTVTQKETKERYVVLVTPHVVRPWAREDSAKPGPDTEVLEIRR
jgi:Flp pilus assembly secretin CpaC